MSKTFCFLTILFLPNFIIAQTPKELGIKKGAVAPVNMVNVFLGSSGDHGQMSPAASYPFSMMSIGPQTYPSTHMGYEYLAKEFLGFTHNRFEGVGCLGSGGNILIKPFIGEYREAERLIKSKEVAEPGYYEVGFTNGINAAFTVYKKAGIHQYQFPKGQIGFYIDLSHAFVNRFEGEEHAIEANAVSGFVEAGTTCSAGKYKLYYYLQFSKPVKWSTINNHKLIAKLQPQEQVVEIRIAFSSVSVEFAKKNINNSTFNEVRTESSKDWDVMLGQVTVKGDLERLKLFYSMLYRGLQSPYAVSENDGNYRAINGSLQQSKNTIYNGWAIWDNFKTQLPLLSIVYPNKFQDIAASIANLYPYGKKDFATDHEPSNTVRTEHAIIVLLDAYRKGYEIPFNSIVDSLKAEVDRLNYASPDKALEASYDAWALSEIFKELKQEEESEKYRHKALEYKKYWLKDFQDLTKSDLDKLPARSMYQGTVWQYRWLASFDVQGLKELAGGEQAFVNQLDEFFDKDYYNHANEPDFQVPWMYNATQQPWKSQKLIHKIAVDTMVQHYFNDNSRGIGSFIGKLYKNQPQAYLRTMDDDAGAMSSWFVFASLGLAPACVGEPVYYLSLPLFKNVVINLPEGNSFSVSIKNYAKKNAYIKEAFLNGKPLNRNWLTHQEIIKGGKLEFISSDKPQKWGLENQYITSLIPNIR